MKTCLFILNALLLFATTTMAQPATYRAEDVIRIPTQDTLRHNVMLSGESIDVAGYLDNDLFAAARNFTMNGKVTDDAFVASRVVSVYGDIGDMLMTAGETVIIEGTINGDLFAAGQEVRISENASIGGNAFIGAETVILEGGHIEGTLRLGGADVQLNGTVNGAVEIYSNQIVFGEKYRAAYGTTITSSESIHRENLGVIPPDLILKTEESGFWGLVFMKIWFYLSLLLTGLILIWIFQQTAVDMAKFASEQYWKSTGWGLLSFFAIPIVIILLAILVITIPIALLLALSYTMVLFISYLLVAMSLGVWSIHYVKGEVDPVHYYYGLALGIIYIAILTNLPFIGGIVNAVLLFFGLGSVVQYIWAVSQSPNRAGPSVGE
ncbi:MAG: hypothetical protein ACQETE_05450 [Bacteroidota bacterium]